MPAITSLLASVWVQMGQEGFKTQKHLLCTFSVVRKQMFPLEQGGQKILKKRKKEKQKEKKNPLRSCAINSLEIHRFNEIKGLNA